MIRTRLTERLGIEHPILLAPMGLVAGGELAAAVSAAGGLGLIGGGYGDAAWLRAQFDEAGNQPVGAGFITWSLAKQPELLELCLERSPRAMIFAFGDAPPPSSPGARRQAYRPSGRSSGSTRRARRSRPAPTFWSPRARKRAAMAWSAA